jgi:hypothetical protein
VPKKIRELKALLLKADFTYRPGKGSHTIWSHPFLPYSITLSDADRYQERDVRNALRDLEEIEEK